MPSSPSSRGVEDTLPADRDRRTLYRERAWMRGNCRLCGKRRGQHHDKLDIGQQLPAALAVGLKRH